MTNTTMINISVVSIHLKARQLKHNAAVWVDHGGGLKIHKTTNIHLLSIKKHSSWLKIEAFLPLTQEQYNHIIIWFWSHFHKSIKNATSVANRNLDFTHMPPLTPVVSLLSYVTTLSYCKHTWAEKQFSTSFTLWLFYGGASELPFQSPNIRLMVEQTTIIILANKTDPHLSAANASFCEHTAAASDEWTCLLCSVWCRLARCPAPKHLTWILTVKQLKMSRLVKIWRGGLGNTDALIHYFLCPLILCRVFMIYHDHSNN